ncbi:MAG TPA: GEVED domain-containing protein [Chitinophagaceae bacterium]|nr:GEVED domain-containing protein [Chitinophagaceae bacterium]
MKKLYILLHFFTAWLLLAAHPASGQCTTTNLNWDHLDFLDPGFSAHTLPICQSQNFAFGTQVLTVTNNYASASIIGENADHTGEAGSFGTGQDVQMMGDGTITVSFANAVSAVKFSIYDIDYNQRVTVTALNGATPVNITMALVSGTNLTITGSGTSTAYATAGATNAIDKTSSDGTINVTITADITSFTIAVTQTGTKTTGPAGGREDGSFWISDLEACSPGSFTASYHGISQPWTGMPSYVLAVRDNNIYYVDPATGRARFIFQDAGHTNINSLAYDPVNHYFYYTYSLTGNAANDKILRRYHYDTDTLGIVMNDVSTLGIPLYDNGVESGAASFYDGSLYMGIEANGANYTANRESKVWKIDFSGTNPVNASQVYGIDGSGHDWGDIGVTNGTLYDFDADAGSENFYVIPLVSRAVTQPPSPANPKQTAIDWQGNLYNIGNIGGSPSTGFVATYSTAGVQGTQQTITLNGTAQSGSWGDGAEAFKPMVDFGDAPATYDPDPMAPALNERDTAIRFGNLLDIEWLKTSSIPADADGTDEDGIITPTVFNPAGTTYNVEVAVYNNSGANADVIGWLDYNNNGLFDSGEASATVTLNSSASVQNVFLVWTGISTTLTVGSYTYLRIRITSSSHGMTSANATGYFWNGETEDYRILVDNIPLGIDLISFQARLNEFKKVNLNWTAIEDNQFTGYEVERSANNRDWTTLQFIAAKHGNGQQDYMLVDPRPLKGTSYYRLKLTDASSPRKYSEIRSVTIADLSASVSISPNPATTAVTLGVKDAVQENNVTIRVYGSMGNLLKELKTNLVQGANSIVLPVENWPSGMYTVTLVSEQGIVNKKLVIRK